MGYLSDYENRVDLYIDSDRVDETLTDFPIMLKLSENCGIEGINASHVFTTISGSSKKIAITTSDGTTQCPVEVEYWDETEKKAILWTKIPTVYSGTDTKFYLYYDATASGNYYVGDVSDSKTAICLEPGAEGTYDDDDFWSHSVIKDSGSYRMLYSGRATSDNDWRIIYCDSTDGINWSNHEMVIDKNEEGTYDSDSAYEPCLMKDGDKYKCWYSGYDSADYRIMYAESDDCTTWSGHQMIINKGAEGTYDSDRVRDPYVIKDGSNYKMWYQGRDGSGDVRILYASSSDGINWSNFQMVVDKGAEGTYDVGASRVPFVMKNDSLYEMWYTGQDNSNDYRIIYAKSTNGISWTDHELNIDQGFEGTADDRRSYSAAIVAEDENFFRIWYTGENNSSGVRKIIHTQSFDSGQNWMTPSQAAWSNNYLGVFHLSEDPSGGSSSIKDSTANENHGNAEASMTSGDLVDGVAGKCIDFDGGDDYIQLYTPSEAANVLGNEQSGSITHSVWFRSESTSGDSLARVVSRDYSDYWATRIDQSAASGSQSLDVGYQTSGGVAGLSASNLNTNQWYFNVQVLDYSAGEVELYLDTSLVDSASNLVSSVGSSRGVCLAMNEEGGPNYMNYFDGKIDEFRISNVTRSVSWIKTDYYSNRDQLVSMQQFFPSHIEGTLYDQYGFPMETECNVIVSELDGTFVNTGTTNNDGSYSIPVARGGPDRRFVVTFYLDERYRLDENLAGAEILTSVSGTV